jgi:hypothetical protein
MHRPTQVAFGYEEVVRKTQSSGGSQTTKEDKRFLRHCGMSVPGA